MAGTVETARLQADRAEERVRLLATAQWTSDSDVNACSLCASPFSFSRRRVGFSSIALHSLSHL